MIERTLVKIYAEALFQIADERGRVEEVYGELQQLECIFNDSKEFTTFLTSPKVERQEKKRLLQKVLSSDFSRLTIHFLLTLIDKNREILIPYMANEFKDILDRIHNRIDVEITSAMRLQDDLLRKATETLSRSLNKEILVNQKIDPDILGGIVVRVEDRILDGSIRGQIERLKAQMLGKEIRRVTVNED
jgi:F-type H+-transporting ATPase subunit delta